MTSSLTYSYMPRSITPSAFLHGPLLHLLAPLHTQRDDIVPRVTGGYGPVACATGHRAPAPPRPRATLRARHTQQYKVINLFRSPLPAPRFPPAPVPRAAPASEPCECGGLCMYRSRLRKYIASVAQSPAARRDTTPAGYDLTCALLSTLSCIYSTITADITRVDGQVYTNSVAVASCACHVCGAPSVDRNMYRSERWPEEECPSRRSSRRSSGGSAGSAGSSGRRASLSPPAAASPRRTKPQHLDFLVSGKQILKKSDRASSLPGAYHRRQSAEGSKPRKPTDSPRRAPRAPPAPANTRDTSLEDHLSLDLSQVGRGGAVLLINK
uniref:SFRICE_016855 n=1 Tax=Spodoptera frugiperda TaxID=7108 RepID=A0A2H1VN49_SPOFR